MFVPPEPLDTADEISAPADELRALRTRQHELLQEAVELEASIAAVRASRTWQLVRVATRLRQLARLAWVRLAWGLARVARTGLRRVPRNVSRAPLGVNVAGYLATESGMGEAARASVRSLMATGIP